MTRVVDFTDGFTSASAPVIAGGEQADYLLLNNQAAYVSLFTIDAADYKSAYGTLEISRSETGAEFRQLVDFKMHFNGTSWVFNFGAYQGDDLAQAALTLDEHVIVDMSTAGTVGTVRYKSGNMSAVYDGDFRFTITRIVAA